MWWPAVPAVAVWVLALTVWDLRTHRLPDALTLPPAAIVLAFATAAGHGVAALVGGLGLAACYLVVHLIDPAGMGAGDVTLALGLGALTATFGTTAWTLAAAGAPLLTVIWAATTGRQAVPHGPAMCAASASAIAVALAVT